jgi:hypothetical protein
VDLVHHLIADTDESRVVVCDYTGSDMSWAPGPLVFTIESIYPFTVGKEDIFYHSPPNVCYTTWALDWVKKKQSILVLPLLGQYLRVYQEPSSNFERVCGLGRTMHC